jgi:hypothetical protein
MPSKPVEQVVSTDVVGTVLVELVEVEVDVDVEVGVAWWWVTGLGEDEQAPRTAPPASTTASSTARRPTRLPTIASPSPLREEAPQPCRLCDAIETQRHGGPAQRHLQGGRFLPGRVERPLHRLPVPG